MGNRPPNGHLGERQYPPEAITYYRYIFGDYHTPIPIGPSPHQPVAIVHPMPPVSYRNRSNRFAVVGVPQRSHLGSSSSSSRGMVGPSNRRTSSYDLQLQNDEALARALQEAENGFGNMSMQGQYNYGNAAAAATGYTNIVGYGGTPYEVGNPNNIDTERMSYEQLQALEESSGSVSQGLSEEQISMLPSHKYRPPRNSKDEDKECPICKMEYTRGDKVTTLPCAHQYHENCIKRWLKSDKKCCICKKETEF